MQPTKDLAFERSEYNQRIQQVRALSRSRGIDVFISHTPENICYLTGYQTLGFVMYQCLLVPLDSDPVLILRQNEIGNFHRYCVLEDVRPYVDGEHPVEATASVLSERHHARGRIGVELDSWFLTAKRLFELKESMPDAVFVDGSGIVEQCRVVKSAAEIAHMRAAARTAEIAMSAAIEAVHAGVSDNTVAAELHRALYAAGSEYVSFPAFVGAGYKSTIGHGSWSRKRIERGESVILEIGGSINRYNAALMRTVSVGPPPPKLEHMAKASEVANRALNQAIRPGVTAQDVHRTCQGVFEEAGLIHLRRGNRSGYSIGIAFPPDWGEGHILSLQEGEGAVLRPGMVFHTPSAIREYGVFGASFSETVLVTEGGSELLTSYERTLFVRD